MAIRGAAVWAFGALAAAVSAASADSFLLRNVDVYPVTSPPVRSASILVLNGKIAEIGTKIAAAKDIRAVDGKGLRVYPGLIDSGTELGLSEISDVRATVDTAELGVFMPQLRALVAVNPESEHFGVVRANGITAAVTFPALGEGHRSEHQIISGQAAVIHTDGWTWEEMEVNRSAALHLIFPVLPRGPEPGFAESKKAYDRQLQQLADFFAEARRYRTAKAAGGAGFRPDLKLDAVLPALEGKVPVAVTAEREPEIRAAIKFVDEQKIRMILLAPRELGKTAADLKSRHIPVVLGRTLELPLDEDAPYDSAFTLPAEALRAGLKIAFGTFDNEFVRDLPYNAAAAVAYGLPYDEALKAMTINPAEIWGVADRMGSIEKGKWADLMLVTGDPLETPSQVKALYIKGKPVDLSNRQTRLYEKYLNRP